MIDTKITGFNRLELEVGDIICNHNNIYNDMGICTKVLLKNSICEVVSIDDEQQTVTVRDISDPNKCEFTCKNRYDELCSLKMIKEDFSHISNVYLWAHTCILFAFVLPFAGLLLYRYWNTGYMLIFTVLLSAVLLGTAYILLTSVSSVKESLYRYLKQMRSAN